MTFEDAQNRSDLLHLGTRIKAHLPRFTIMRINEAAGTGIVTGSLNLSHDEIKTSISARCSFRFGTNWPSYPPIVSTNEPWLNRDPEWHAYSDGSLCYLYARHWLDEVAPMVSKYDIAVAADFGAYWCIRSVQWLLYRHHFAFEHGIKKWPTQWPFWSHGQKAEFEYKKFKRRNERLSRSAV